MKNFLAQQIKNIITIYLLGFSFFAFSEFSSSVFDENNINELNESLSDTFGKTLTNTNYDPILWTIASGIESTKYKINTKDFTETASSFNNSLSFGENSIYNKPYYQGDMNFYTRLNKKSSKAIVVLSSSYNTWKSGTWIKKLISLIDKIYPEKINIIIFPGYLSPKNFLETGKPSFPDITGEFVAHDLYNRLISSKIDFSMFNQVGAIGFSGGASIAVEILNADRKYAKENNQKAIFNLGAIAFSPIVSTSNTCICIDSNSKLAIKAGWSPKKGLFSLGTLSYLKINHSNVLDSPSSIMSLNSNNPNLAKYLVKAFSNEFISYDLKHITNSSQSEGYTWDPKLHFSDIALLRNGKMHGWGYGHYYKDYAFKHWQESGYFCDETVFEKINISDQTINIDVPLILVNSMDDPVLSMTYENYSKLLVGKNDEITNILNEVKLNKNVKVINLKYGAHMAYLLETSWYKEVLTSFFQIK